ncbi:MAG TPA: YfhO family protein [Candidatus Hydrogenedentes bacterium]|nr:YfhO family protein [Candidatus Hydrogenedentota bacterium]HRT21050.1 YfhO family protein [Candidatus Hydrogenedentota bacterium]HRT65879.1 YfhO family protein [Candidatus Hydrogenedentota bacterium]
MGEFAFEGNRYSLLRLFGVAVFFIVIAPVFWRQTQLHPDAIGAAYENADLYQSIYPSFHYGFSRIRAGQLPLWNAKELCGTPFLAQPSTALFQPINVVFLFLPTEQAMAVHAYLCLAMMGIGFVAFARALDLGYTAALIGGILYAFCGASAAAASRPAIAAALAWTPCLFWGMREAMRQTRFGCAVPAGLAGAALMLCGTPAVSLHMLLAALTYGLFLGFYAPDAAHGPDMRERFERLLIITVIAVAVSAVQWVPTLAWLLLLDRPWDALWAVELPAQAPMSFHELVAQAIVPQAGALPHLVYMGAAPLAAIPLAFIHHASRRDAFFFAPAAAALLALAVIGPERFPASFPHACAAFPASFLLAALAAIGFDRLLLTRRGTHALRLRHAAVILFVVTAVLFYVSPLETRGRLAVLLGIALPVVLFRWKWVSIAAGLALATAFLADLSTANKNLYAHPFSDAPACYQRHGRTLRLVEEQTLGARMLTAAPPVHFGLPLRLGMIRAGLYEAGGLAPLTRDQAIWWRRLGTGDAAKAEAVRPKAILAPEAELPGLLNAMAVRAIVVAPESPLADGRFTRGGLQLSSMHTDDGAILFRNNTAWPRALWVPTWRIAEGAAAAANLLGMADFDGLRECTIDRDSPGFDTLAAIVPGPRDPAGTPLPNLPEGLSCSVEDHGAEHVIVRTRSPQPGIVVLADTYDPGWKATMDGTPCPILRANGLFRGVAAPAGSHEIVFSYRPWPFFTGAALSLGALGLLALLGTVIYLRG